MTRRNRRKPQGRALIEGAAGSAERVSLRAGDWIARQVSGLTATKDYRCPGCNQLIPQGQPHVVAWQEGWSVGVDGRRHWHTACWRSKLRLK